MNIKSHIVAGGAIAIAAVALAGMNPGSGVSSAGASSAVTLSSSRPDDQSAASTQDSSTLQSHDLQCPGGYYVAGVEMVETTGGTYPSIEQVSLTCRNIENKSDTVRVSWPDDIVYVEGATWGSPDYVRDQDCSADGGFVTGMKIDHDRYVKDFQVRCGEQQITTARDGTQSVKIDNHGYTGDWVFDRTEADDSQTGLVCNDSTRLMTGIRLRYKEDSDEIAITRTQLSCALLKLS